MRISNNSFLQVAFVSFVFLLHTSSSAEMMTRNGSSLGAIKEPRNDEPARTQQAASRNLRRLKRPKTPKSPKSAKSPKSVKSTKKGGITPGATPVATPVAFPSASPSDTSVVSASPTEPKVAESDDSIPSDLTCSASALDYTLPVEGPFSSIPAPFPGPHLGGLMAALEAWVTGLVHYETPYAIRLEHMIDIMDWNCAAIYSASYKDALTKTEPLFRAPASIILDDGSTTGLHNSDLRLMCMAGAYATVVEDWVPQALPAMKHTLEAFQYPGLKFGYNSDVMACFSTKSTIFSDGSSPDSSSCLEAIAQEACYRPSVVGQIVAQQVSDYGKYDGWNMYGNTNADGSQNTFNGRRYRDTTGYEPVYDPNDEKLKKHWSPLLEDNGSGYFTRQEHVAPHIGSMAKPRLLSREDVNRKVLVAPDNDYDTEAQMVTSRLANLTDEKKMMIEFFDNKINVAFALVSNIAVKGASFEQILNYIVGFTAGSYDSTILAWKEKISHDLVRPTTWIQDQMTEVEFDTWVKGKQGTHTVKGKEFESFIRVMPHAEFPSGSSCIFQHVYEFTDKWIEENLGISGSMPLMLGTLPAGSSKSEPGMTPANTITLSVSNLLELRDLGGQSRLDGGMHFTASIEAGHKLCEGVGNAAAQFALELW